MGRTTPSRGAPPPSQRKDARAKRAKQTINKDISALLQAHPRARRGLEASQLIVDPQHSSDKVEAKGAAVDTEPAPHPEGDTEGDAVTVPDVPNSRRVEAKVSIQCADTLEVAARFCQVVKSKHTKPPRLAVLNMASPLRPGGGFLTGAQAQEESLCLRTTLYPSLKEEFYRLPELGGIYTPDVLVFRSHDAKATDLPKTERFFVDVITAAMHRMPEVEEDEEGQKSYANSKDREMAEKKMRAVLRIAHAKHVDKLVLGAWGCGAYENPINEIARGWKRVLDEEVPSGTTHAKSMSGLKTMGVVFAIKELKMADQFAQFYGVKIDERPAIKETEVDLQEEGGTAERSATLELSDRISQLESQIASTRSDILRQRLKNVLDSIRPTVD